MKLAALLENKECAIIYTDFIDDVEPIMNALHSHGLDSVAYYGEMDAKSRRESYDKWRSGKTNIMFVIYKCIWHGNQQTKHIYAI